MLSSGYKTWTRYLGFTLLVPLWQTVSSSFQWVGPWVECTSESSLQTSIQIYEYLHISSDEHCSAVSRLKPVDWHSVICLHISFNDHSSIAQLSTLRLPLLKNIYILPSHLMTVLFREVITIHCENRMKYVNILYRQNVEFVNFNPNGSSVKLTSTALSSVPCPMLSSIGQDILQCFVGFPKLLLPNGRSWMIKIRDFLENWFGPDSWNSQE